MVCGMRLLQLALDEPLPGNVMPEMAADVGGEEAARRYRAIALTTMRQLRWLERARLRLLVPPDDAGEAVRFWLLPRLAGNWSREGAVFRAEGWEIDFGGELAGFRVIAEGEILCPMAGARWVQAALPGLGAGFGRVTGPVAGGGGRYFSAVAAGGGGGAERRLPPLPLIRLAEDWDAALGGPLGPSLKRAWDEEG